MYNFNKMNDVLKIWTQNAFFFFLNQLRARKSIVAGGDEISETLSCVFKYLIAWKISNMKPLPPRFHIDFMDIVSLDDVNPQI